MNKVFIIAEAGVNHNGDIKLAKQLVDIAYLAGCDAIKFQTFKAENLVTKHAEKAAYQKELTDTKESQFEMLKKLELNEVMHKELISYCKQKNILFLSTPFDMESIELLNDLSVDIFKIPSGEITNLPYLRKIAKLGKKMIVSTGMATMEEVGVCLEIIKQYNPIPPTILHCSTLYPTPMEDVNLLAMNAIKQRYQCEVGYSDHTLGIEVAIAAVALGATVIEKHITLDKTMEGPDHKASLEPQELNAMVQAIRNIEKALGKDEKCPTALELQNQNVVRKSIVAKRQIQKGDVFTEENLTVKRPATGLSPMYWDQIIGTKAYRDYQIDELIEEYNE